MSDIFEYETNDGIIYEFDNKEQRDNFAIDHLWNNLVGEGYGEIITMEKTGERAFQINDKGLQYLKDIDQLPSSTH